jgi:FkbM family methyltransferase
LKINYVLNKRLRFISSPIIIIEKAAWESSNDKVKINIPLTGSQIYFGLSGISPGVKFLSTELNVNTCTLDEELRILGLENKNIKVLKVDVEGSEKAVLLGARNLLKRTLKIYVECSKNNVPYIIEFLKGFGFKFTYIDAKEVIHLLGTKILTLSKKTSPNDC